MSKTTYLYFIQQGYGAIKVGVSSDPKKRLKALQTATSKPLRLLCSIPFGSRQEAFNMERELHEKYAHLCCRGEWLHPRFLKELRIGKGKRSPRMIGGTRKQPYGGLLADAIEIVEA